MFAAGSARACEICSAPQPKILRELTHGAGPQGGLDYAIVGAAMIMVLLTLAGSIRCLLRPGEHGAGHIKRTVFHHDLHGS